MQFRQINLKDAYLITLDKKSDERGFFARTWCVDEFRKHGIEETFVQANIGLSIKRRTLRGFHYQSEPYEEAKLVRCTAGAIFDVIIDLRTFSPTFKQWQGFELYAEEHSLLFIPKGFAHAYMTLKDNTEVFYMVSQFYTPNAEKGIRWDDPTFNIPWPEGGPIIISEKDKKYVDFRI
jgi:dTDP-4-dehydrorhamnose 3,5-epimerase